MNDWPIQRGEGSLHCSKMIKITQISLIDTINNRPNIQRDFDDWIYVEQQPMWWWTYDDLFIASKHMVKTKHKNMFVFCYKHILLAGL